MKRELRQRSQFPNAFHRKARKPGDIVGREGTLPQETARRFLKPLLTARL